MKKQYVTLELNYILCYDEDIVRTSSIEVDGTKLFGDDGWSED